MLLLSLYSRDVYKLFIWVDYTINVEAITEEYCINKDDVAMQCNGKCHLSKQLSFVDGVKESPEKPSDPKSIDERIPLFVSENLCRIDLSSILNGSVTSFALNLNRSSGFLMSIDHPPEIIA